MNITPSQACNHPNWSMGAVISVNSATMMNKFFEVIEAIYLFQKNYNDINVVIQPTSAVHAIIYHDSGLMSALLGYSSMKFPIIQGLFWPKRQSKENHYASLIDIGNISFKKLDIQRFPCFDLSYKMIQDVKSTAITSLHAINDVAVNAFFKKTSVFFANQRYFR